MEQAAEKKAKRWGTKKRYPISATKNNNEEPQRANQFTARATKIDLQGSKNRLWRGPGGFFNPQGMLTQKWTCTNSLFFSFFGGMCDFGPYFGAPSPTKLSPKCEKYVLPKLYVFFIVFFMIWAWI